MRSISYYKPFLPVPYRYKTWSLTGKQHGLRMFENRVLRRMQQKTGENCVVRICIICTILQILG
jgi:hypothetical protein